VGATTEGSVINKNGDVGVLNPFELDSSMPTKLISYATQVASAAIKKLSKLVEELLQSLWKKQNFKVRMWFLCNKLY
jgi:hypothetical protein